MAVAHFQQVNLQMPHSCFLKHVTESPSSLRQNRWHTWDLNGSGIEHEALEWHKILTQVCKVPKNLHRNV